MSRRRAGLYRIGQKYFADVVNSDATFAVVNGVPPDEGVMVELGMAIALGKPTFLFRDDFRRATDSEEYPAEFDAVHRYAPGGVGWITTTPHCRRSPLPGRPWLGGRGLNDDY